jgi:hypothetical protein
MKSQPPDGEAHDELNLTVRQVGKPERFWYERTTAGRSRTDRG